ncbi:YggT family protein [Corynebacterium sp. TAE3-ERU30]|nr:MULTISPECIES: YggT family protein [unclassified Corynebacterium]MBV7281646.1 YggT family protein [Corynebacterium sp. TAE3-ERU30]MBV7301286.1 YggT family protein [Corynebacterium sp. TAE3-ERU2]
MILLWAIRIFRYVLIARILIEMVVSFSRSFSPPRWFYYIAEPIFMVTDPPVKALRRMIPSVRMGGVALDVSVLVLFIGLILLEYIVIAIYSAAFV